MGGVPVDELAAHTAPHRVFEHRGWRFAVRLGPMWSEDRLRSAERAAAAEGPLSSSPPEPLLQPDALFGHNFVWLQSPAAVGQRCLDLRFRAIDSLRGTCTTAAAEGAAAGSEHWAPKAEGCSFDPQPLRAHAADVWAAKVQKLKGTTAVRQLSSSYDWTFASKYWGTAATAARQQSDATADAAHLVPLAAPDGAPAPVADSRIVPAAEADAALPLELLKDTTVPILWFQQVPLLDDDLADGGLSRTVVKIRVMPNFFFLLMRQDIRVDGVGLRQVDTRLFHKFGTEFVVRDFRWREASMEVLRKRLPPASEGEPDSTRSLDSRIGAELLLPEDSQWRVTCCLPLPA